MTRELLTLKCFHTQTWTFSVVITANIMPYLLILIVTLLPIFLLVCYPMRLFQRLSLSKLRLDCVFINIFVERFYIAVIKMAWMVAGAREALLDFTIHFMLCHCSFNPFEVSVIYPFHCFSNLYLFCSVDLSYKTV